MLRLVPFAEQYLDKSYEWLNDPEIRSLIDGPASMTREGQKRWYNLIKNDPTYQIWGIEYDGMPIGACGIKHIDTKKKSGEYWGYIGEKNFWGGKGHLIFEQIYKKAHNLELDILTLNVLKNNIRALRLYEKESFEYLSEKDNTITMIKRI